MSFVYVNYPAYAQNPVDILSWCYQQAAYQEHQKFLNENAMNTDAVYKKPA